MTDQTHQAATEWQNLFGVCACIGEDFGFDPTWLRVAFGVALIANPPVVIGSYFALGAVVLASRLALPNRKRPPTAVARIEPAAEPDFKLAA